jgi:hypothetical protein
MTRTTSVSEKSSLISSISRTTVRSGEPNNTVD